MPRLAYRWSHAAIVALLMAALLAACSPSSEPTDAPALPKPTSTLPPDEIQIEDIMLGFPQPYSGDIYITVIGSLSDACTQINSIEHQFEEDNALDITIDTTRSGDETCAPGPVPFKEIVMVTIGDLYAGTYIITVNGVRETVVLDESFPVPLTPDPGS